MAVSLVGLAAAFGVPRAPRRPTSRCGSAGISSARRSSVTRQAAANRPVWLSILGLSWFWAIGATLLSEFPSVAQDALGADGHVVTLLLTMFAVGIGVGSMLCARLLHGEVSARFVPFAASASPCSPGILLAVSGGRAAPDRRSARAGVVDRMAHAGRSAAAVGMRRPLFGAAVCHRAGAVGTLAPGADDRGEQHRQCGDDGAGGGLRRRVRRGRHVGAAGAADCRGGELRGRAVDRPAAAADRVPVAVPVVFSAVPPRPVSRDWRISLWPASGRSWSSTICRSWTAAWWRPSCPETWCSPSIPSRRGGSGS